MSKKLTKAQVAPIRKAISAKQGDRCALCDVSFNERTVKNGKVKAKYTRTLDHCHNHGHVREVLCNNCNGREGEIFNRARRCKRDGTEAEWLQKLVDYWIKHSEPQTPYIHPDHKTEEDKRLAKNAAARRKRASATAAAMLKKRK